MDKKVFDFDEAYDILLANGVSEQALFVACVLTGRTLETLDKVCAIVLNYPSVYSLVKRK